MDTEKSGESSPSLEHGLFIEIQLKYRYPRGGVTKVAEYTEQESEKMLRQAFEAAKSFDGALRLLASLEGKKYL